MSNYKRIYLSDCYHFFTVVTANRKAIFAKDENVQLLREAFLYVQSRKPFKIEAICVLPDHLHCIWKLQGDIDFSTRWQMVKTYFSRQIRLRNARFKNIQIWQPRFWEHVIRDNNDFNKHLDYIHYNPVKHGLVNNVDDWPYSSYSKFCDLGYYAKNWGQCEPKSLSGLQLE